MLKNNFFIIKIKNYIFPFIFLAFTICLVLFSNSNLSAAKTGLSLWVNSVVPSLFPFFIATELLSHTNIIKILGNLLNNWMKPIFNVRGEGSFALIMGIISGYPIGAKIASNFRKEGVCSKEECERLLSFTNNSGPLFIVGTVGISMFGSTTIGILLFITHLLASLTVGFLFRFWKYKPSNNRFRSSGKIDYQQRKTVSISNLGEVIGNSITNSISTIMMIGGFVVLFSVVISILKASHLLALVTVFLEPVFSFCHIPASFISPLITGFLEITNGINSISAIHIKNISINIIITAFLLGFGGISVMLQVFSIVAKTDLSMKSYVLGKLLHGIIAAFYTFVVIYTIPMFNFNL